MRDPGTYGQTAIRGFLAHLPPGAHSIYFKDAIGNISTSQIRPGMQSTEVILTPRYPLYGGWKAEFVLGYSLPLQVTSKPLPIPVLLKRYHLQRPSEKGRYAPEQNGFEGPFYAKPASILTAHMLKLFFL